MNAKLVIAVSMITVLWVVPNQGFCEVNVLYNDFSDLSGFTLGANAADLNIVPDNILQLSSGTWQRSGYAYLIDRVQLETTFSTYFSFRINNNVGGGDSDGLGADWLMFLFKHDVGYFNADDFAIEFDIFNNGARDKYSGNHVGINYGNQFVTTQHVDKRFNDGDIWHVWIDYDGINISVYVSLDSTKPPAATIVHAVNIFDYLPDVNPLIGFQSASGAYGADFEILNWSFVSPVNNVSCIDTMPPAGAVHAYPNVIWPPNNKLVKISLSGKIYDEMSVANDGIGIGVHSAYLLINGSDTITLRDEIADLIDSDGNFRIDIDVFAKKNAGYVVELYASDTNSGGMNWGLVDTTYIKVISNNGNQR